jgi:sugar phosphate isomerase/epimerase
MQLGFVSAILPEHSFTQVLEVARRIGYDCFEVMCWPPGRADRRYAGVSHLDVTRLDSVQASEVKHQLHESNVSLSGLGYYPNLLSPDLHEAEAATIHLRQVIAAAPQLGLSQVNTFIGRNWRISVEDNWPRMLEVWQPILRYAEDHGVRIGIENCPMLFSADEWPGGKNLATSPAIWTRMFHELDSTNIGLNYDPSHLVWQHIDYLEPLRSFADRIFHVHAKDVRIDRQRLNQVGILAHPSQYHTPKLPGMGEVDWGMFFSLLTDSGYRGPVCVEVEDRAFEHNYGDRVRSLVQSHQYLRNFIPR